MAIASPLSVRFLAPTLIVKGVDTVVQVDVERDGAAVTIAVSPAPVLQVFGADGVQVGSNYAVTASGTTLTATVPGADTSAKDYSGAWLVRWSFTVTGDRAYSPYNVAALCRGDLQCPIGVTDLLQRNALLERVALNGKPDLGKHIAQAWGELLSQMHRDETPYWAARSPAALRPWLLAKAREIAFDDAATALGTANPYSREARRLEALLPDLYAALQLRFDEDEDDKVDDRSVPVMDKRGRP